MSCLQDSFSTLAFTVDEWMEILDSQRERVDFMQWFLHDEQMQEVENRKGIVES